MRFFKKLFQNRSVKVSLAMVVALMASAQIADAQNITLNFDKAPLKSVLNEIQKQTDYTFVYNDALIGAKNIITIKVTNETLTSVLDMILIPNGISYTILDKQVALAPSPTTSVGQTPKPSAGTRELKVTVKGSIYDTNGEKLAGVAIVDKKTNAYAISDENGNYSIDVKNVNEAELEFTLLGMETVVIPTNGRSVMNVIMTSSRLFIDEIVVTGYQNIQKEKVTGSISTVSSKALEERYNPNLLNSLEGKVAGLSTYGGKLTIRGVSSIYSETQPLIVLDGLPVETSLDDLNPYDIESINVLKDAAAAAIYGARASNGIIVINTKSAKDKGKIDVDFSSNITLYEKRNMDYGDNFYMNAAQQVKTESEYYDYYFNNNDGEVADPIGSFESSLNSGSSALSPIQYAYYKNAIGQISKEQLNILLSKYSQNNFAQEYADAVYLRKILQQYNLAIRSRADNFNSNFVINYKQDNQGVINSGYKQININYKGSYDIAKWLTATLSVNGIYDKNRTQGYDYNASFTNPWMIPAYETMYNEDGSYKKFFYWYDGNEYWDKNEVEGYYPLGTDIVAEHYNNTVTTKRQYMRYHGDLLFKIINGLTATAQFVYESNHTTSDWLATQESHAARLMRNAYTQENPDGTLTYLTPRSGGFKSATNTDGAYWTGRGQVNYANTFGKHIIAALAGIEFRETLSQGTRSLMLGYDDQLQTASTQVIDFATLALMNYSTYLGSYPANQFIYTPYIKNNMTPVTEQKHRYASGYANFTYTYDNRYNVFGSFRKDYADVYGLNVKFRGKPLWSAGFSWNINNEEFMSSVNWINVLKLRISYGVTGNIYQGATSYMTARSAGVNELTNLPYGVIESPANPNLKWEQTRTTNIGIDYSFAENRFRGSLDFYNKVGKDLFSYKTLDPSTGFSSMFMNMADMVNRGVELSLTADWFRESSREDFGWSSSLTFAINKNKVTDIENPSTMAYQLVSTPYRVGYPTSAVWSYRFAGISSQEGEKGMTLWYMEDDNKAHSVASRSIDILEYSGQSEPVLVASFDNRLTWKGFSLSVLMAYYGGHVMRALPEVETFGVPYSAVASYFVNAWTPDNPTNTPGIGRYASYSLGSEPRYGNNAIHSAAFLKIRNIVFGYDFPESWLDAVNIQRASLKFQIDNPRAIWMGNKVKVDPETMGIRLPSTFIFGININF